MDCFTPYSDEMSWEERRSCLAAIGSYDCYETREKIHSDESLTDGQKEQLLHDLKTYGF